jgi:hypothetical protein
MQEDNLPYIGLPCLWLCVIVIKCGKKVDVFPNQRPEATVYMEKIRDLL